MGNKTCSTCIWLSSGWQDARGAGWCYSEGDYKAADDTCPFWKKSLRDEPVNDPPIREDLAQ